MDISKLEVQDGTTLKSFTITPMSAYKAEQWMYRAAFAMGRNVDDIQQVFSDKPADLLKAILTIPYDEARPLLDDLLSCCTLVQGNALRRLEGESACAVIESPLTLTKLRIESLRRNFGFFFDGDALKSLMPQSTETPASK